MSLKFTLKNNKSELLSAANDLHDDEIVEYIKEAMGDNYPACLFVENDYDIVLYKNSIVWCAIECYAFEICDEELMKERLI